MPTNKSAIKNQFVLFANFRVQFLIKDVRCQVSGDRRQETGPDTGNPNTIFVKISNLKIVIIAPVFKKNFSAPSNKKILKP